MHIEGYWIDLMGEKIQPSRITIEEGRIQKIEKILVAPDVYIAPGYVDAHIHLESSMLVPAEFARQAVVHGTVATVSDPHEIANVLGVPGVEFMIENGHQVPFCFWFGAPSCVPATGFETAGARLGLEETRHLLNHREIHFLSEMMNVPGVLHQDPEVMAKLALARESGKPVDGHAPGLIGKDLDTYLAAGICTDHEAVSLAEAREKAAKGMLIQMREGSAARNFDELMPLLAEYPDQCMFCSDDRHPDDLIAGHINGLVQRALARGYDLFKVLKAASLNPIRHYGLPVGLLQEGDRADFIVVDNPIRFQVLETWIQGQCVARQGESLLPHLPTATPNRFVVAPTVPADFALATESEDRQIHVIHAIDGELLTLDKLRKPRVVDHKLLADPEHDILKIAVLNRYQPHPPVIGFIENFGLQRGAIASSVAHDSHNLIAIGCSDAELSRALNLVIAHQGGVCALYEDQERILPLPVAGLMSDREGPWVAAEYAAIEQMIRIEMGSHLHAPLMTLSFMALLVIPDIKIGDQGLFDGVHFRFAHLAQFADD